MDHSRFDRLTRALGGATTRRAGLRAALGGLLGLSLAAPLAGVAEAKNHKHKKKRSARCSPDKPCPEGQTCDGEGTSNARCMCDGGIRPCGTVCCPAGQQCDGAAENPRCRCKADGRPSCGGACCQVGEVCRGGACRACTPPLNACSAASECCDSAICRQGLCCLPEGAACDYSTSSHCCGYMRCGWSGRCEEPQPPG